MSRDLRRPVDAAEFDKLPLRALTKRLAAPWWNLRWAHHADPKHLFFASATGRLIPLSGLVPCLYLARTREASFFELYGDDIDAAEKRGTRRQFLRGELENRVFLKTPEEITVRLYDLTAEKSARAIGMDLATLYTPTVDHPHEFAERLHGHPAKFDGIQYASRHTQTLCVALWKTHHPALASTKLVKGPSLWDLAEFDPALPPGEIRLFSTVIAVATSADRP